MASQVLWMCPRVATPGCTARIASRFLPVICLCLLLSACSPYSFSGGRTALVSTVAVPLFENQTPEFGLAEDLTQGIVTGFVEDNQIKVLDAASAEAILSGRIVDYKRKAYTFDQADQVSEYMVEISVSAELVKRATADTVWTVDRLRGSGIYKAEGEEEEQGQVRAIAKIAEDILNRTIRSW